MFRTNQVVAFLIGGDIRGTDSLNFLLIKNKWFPKIRTICMDYSFVLMFIQDICK